MGIVHLKGSMLAEYLGGRVDDPSIRRHVEGCDLCKARLRDDRLLRALIGPGGPGAPGAHVDDDTLAAYCDQALEPSRMQAIDHHLAHCDRCLADYLEVRHLVESPAQAPPRFRELAVESFGLRSLGTLYLSVRGSRMLAFFMSEAEHGPLFSARRPVSPPRGAKGSARHPGRRMSSAVEEPEPPARFERFAASMPADFPGETAAGRAGGDAGERVVIPVDDALSLEIAATPSMLDVRAIDPASGEPRAGVVVRFEYGQGQAHAQETDEKGRAAGKLPPADLPARIVLPGPPTRAIDIQLS